MHWCSLYRPPSLRSGVLCMVVFMCCEACTLRGSSEGNELECPTDAISGGSLLPMQAALAVLACLLGARADAVVDLDMQAGPCPAQSCRS